MAGQRTITKALGGVEDLLHGKGTVQQERAGQIYTITKNRNLRIVDSYAELLTLDPDKFPEVGIVQGDNIVLVQYNGTTYEALDSNYLVYPTFAELGTGLTSDVAALLHTKKVKVKTTVNNLTSNSGGADYGILTTAEKNAAGYAGTEGYACKQIGSTDYWTCLVYNGINTPYNFGATTSNLSTAVKEAIKFNRTADVPAGVFQTPTKVDFQPYPVTIQGKGNATNIHIPTSNPDSTAFRFAAVGGTNREMSKISGLNFTCDVGQTATAIDAQAVFPISLSDVRCYQLGADAIKYYQIYYGAARDMYLFGSGLNFENVNNYTFDGGDFHGNNPLTIFNATDFTHLLNRCDNIRFENLTFEGYINRIMHVIQSKALTFDKVWFEANTADWCIKTDIVQDMHFNNCYLELFPSPTSAFIVIDNTDTLSDLNRTLRTLITFEGGFIRLSESTGSNFKLVDITAGTALVTMQNLSLRSGMTIMHYNADLSVKNLTMSSMTTDEDKMKFIESIPNTDITDGKNGWCVGSQMNDKSMSGGAIITDVTGGGSSAVITTDAFTHQNGISTKIAIPAAETDRLVMQHNATAYGLTTASTNGETYVFFLRVYCSHNITLKFRPLGLAYYQDLPDITTKAGKWVDYVLKTNSAQTNNLASSGTQYLRFELVNNTGQDVEFYIDRIDYKKVLGDHYLP